MLPRLLFESISSVTITFNDFKRLNRWFFDSGFDFIRPVWFKDGQFSSLLATKSGSGKGKKINGYEGDVEGECNVKSSKTLKSCKVSL